MMDNRVPFQVLLVEDDVDIREAIADLLEEFGYAVRAACNGREALDVLATEYLPDLILLDLMMPVMDGWALKAELAESKELQAIPVVVLTADVNVTGLAGSLPGSDYLRKPIAVDQLLRMLDRMRSSGAA